MLHKKAVVLAAGKGTRMKSELPKVLIPVCGKPMIEYVLHALIDAGVTEITVVVGYLGDDVRAAVGNWLKRLDSPDACSLDFVEQKEQLGTGHAVLAARDRLQGQKGPIMILTGDSPMTRSESLSAMFETYGNMIVSERFSQLGGLIGTANKADPFGMGRIVRDGSGRFIKIVEEKDATDTERAIQEVNMSYYLFDIPALLESLDELRADNAQKEYYITDVPAIMMRRGRTVLARPLLSPNESLGVNTPEDLSQVEELIRQGEESHG